MLQDKVCIITGGGSGLGRATAIELANQGVSIVVNDLGTDIEGETEDHDPAQETATIIQDRGGEAISHFGDVTSMEYTKQLVADTVEEYGRVDGVINFAAILRDALTHKMSAGQWDAVIEVHLRGHFSLLRNTATHWREVARDQDDELNKERSFICVSSIAALGNVGQLNYGAAKAGVLGMTRTAAIELDRYNIRVNALMPIGYTRMTEQIPPEHRSFTQEEKPPEKIAPMVGYLLSDAATDVTGCTFWASGDEIGLISNPEFRRLGFMSGGWTVEAIADEFEDNIARGETLNKSSRQF